MFIRRDFLAACLAWLVTTTTAANSTVQWTACGTGFQCTNITVPYDYHNASDTRTMSIAVKRLSVTDTANRKGAVFINPGGPGGSGVDLVTTQGSFFATVFGGQYDVIGFDPRGVGLSRPYVSCFDSLLDQESFALSIRNYMLDLPASDLNSTDVRKDLQRQISQNVAATASLARACDARTGEALAFMSTEAVARDIDTMSKVIEGDSTPINYAAVSYGTAIGQYLIQILPPARIGRIILDGIIDPTHWSDYAEVATHFNVQDTDALFKVFASTCLANGSDCALKAFNFSSPSALLRKIDDTIDSLYKEAVPVFGLGHPAFATAGVVRTALAQSLYATALWPQTASGLADAFKGNFTSLVAAYDTWVNPSDAGNPDNGAYALFPIFCGDTRPYSASHPPPSNAAITNEVLSRLVTYSHWAGDLIYQTTFCKVFDQAGLYPRRSRFAGPFGLANSTLHTPILLLSNALDPVTPLAFAEGALKKLGNNARLVEQSDGLGHTTTSDLSECTISVITAYMVEGAVPSASLTKCTVGHQPFQPMSGVSRREALKMEAWRKLEKARSTQMQRAF